MLAISNYDEIIGVIWQGEFWCSGCIEGIHPAIGRDGHPVTSTGRADHDDLTCSQCGDDLAWGWCDVL